MASESHRRNVLGDFADVGVGAQRVDGVLWVTVDFIKSAPPRARCGACRRASVSRSRTRPAQRPARSAHARQHHVPPVRAISGHPSGRRMLLLLAAGSRRPATCWWEVLVGRGQGRDTSNHGCARSVTRLLQR
jgi:hypothetical protein